MLNFIKFILERNSLKRVNVEKLLILPVFISIRCIPMELYWLVLKIGKSKERKVIWPAFSV